MSGNKQLGLARFCCFFVLKNKQTKNIKMHVWKAKFYSSNTIYEITQICCSASHLTFAIVVNIDFTSPMSCWWATIMVFTELACDLIESLWNMTEKWHHKLLLVTKRVFARESVKMFGTFFVMINCLQVKEHSAVMFSRGSQKLGKTSPKLKRKYCIKNNEFKNLRPSLLSWTNVLKV